MDRRDGGAQLGKTDLHAAPELRRKILRHLASRKVSIAESSMFALANHVPTQGRHPVSVPAMDDRGDYPVPSSNSKAELAAELRTSQQMVLGLGFGGNFPQSQQPDPLISPPLGSNGVCRLQPPGAGTSSGRPPVSAYRRNGLRKGQRVSYPNQSR